MLIAVELDVHVTAAVSTGQYIDVRATFTGMVDVTLVSFSISIQRRSRWQRRANRPHEKCLLPT
ncbi:hypothetical protein CONLIGDRAFT_257516 [Coniochaeta ligniaria NRRL 30616]|uniref:Uncharacterized protein n=1 Tax=Coniochaeta ligniaria NRRL 30616 TaxID=1408157 RepID=A0A1J7JS20_9PEZI|nr:hypothetical protein CONLIGDRAFT_257516 [Coniochaeta ligniaria NRRL 30616]